MAASGPLSGVGVTDARRGFLSGPTCEGNGPPEKDRFDSGTPDQYHMAASAATAIDVNALGLTLAIGDKFDADGLQSLLNGR